MPLIVWRGLPPSDSLKTALAAADLQCGAADDADAVTPLVVFNAKAQVPASGDRTRWIWLCQQAVPERDGVRAVLKGAYAVISLNAPDAVTELIARLRELLVPEPEPELPSHLVAQSAVARRMFAQAARVAPTSMSVLITGETGTGKEVMARLLHAWSPRAKRPFVPINCAAIPNELMEAELFGYARGAFSGAVQRYDGQLTAAEGGTVFLDEIDDTPLETQVKLLRVLEDRVVSRLGENAWHTVDFRLIAATNRNLRSLIASGLFGGDLFERLAIVSIQLTPLRDRLEDLPALCDQFIERYAREQNPETPRTISVDALRALAAYPWPGNIRELRNVIFQTLVYKRAGKTILVSDLPKRILKRGVADEPLNTVDRTAVARKIEQGAMNLRQEVAALERAAIEEALRRTGGNAAQAARLLGEVGRGVARDPGGTLRAMMRRLATSSSSS